MFAPGQRIIHPEFGDITADVIEELVAMGRPQEPVIIEREQAEIAATAGTLARDMSCGRLVAQIHEDAFDYWTRREGLGFWKDKGNLKKFLADNPACAVKSVGRGVQIPQGARVTRISIGRDGRRSEHSAISGACTRPGKGRFAA